MREELIIQNYSSEQIKDLEGRQIRKILSAGLNPILRDSHLKSISKIVDLEELDLEWAEHITDKGIAYLESVQTLLYIDLDFCPLVSDSAKGRLKNAIPNLEIE